MKKAKKIQKQLKKLFTFNPSDYNRAFEFALHNENFAEAIFKDRTKAFNKFLTENQHFNILVYGNSSFDKNLLALNLAYLRRDYKNTNYFKDISEVEIEPIFQTFYLKELNDYLGKRVYSNKKYRIIKYEIQANERKEIILNTRTMTAYQIDWFFTSLNNIDLSPLYYYELLFCDFNFSYFNFIFQIGGKFMGYVKLKASYTSKMIVELKMQHDKAIEELMKSAGEICDKELKKRETYYLKRESEEI